MPCRFLLFVFALLLPGVAHAVFVRGRVLTPLGVPVAYARVQLIQGTRMVGSGISGPDGSYEVRSNLAGRFVLLTSRSQLVQIGAPFYGGALDQVTLDVVLTPNAVYPVPPASEPVRRLEIAGPQLLTEALAAPALLAWPGVFVLSQGPAGSRTFLFVEGAGPAATEVRVDGVSAEDLGGRLQLGTLGASGLASPVVAPALELTVAPGLPDAELATLTLHTPLAETLHPNLTYTGDAGNLASVRNEAVATLAYKRTDVLGSFARFDTANGAGAEAVPFHIATTAFNAGYHLSAGTSLRGTLRDEVSAVALSPFFGIARSGKDAHQDLYASGTFATETSRQWRHTLRYGLVRKREQTFLFTLSVPQFVTVGGESALVTLPGAPAREDQATNRDEATYSTDRPVRSWLHPELTARYQNERAVDRAQGFREALTRVHYTAVPAFTGEIRNRVFYRASATLDDSDGYGFNAAPSLGVTYAAVRPGTRKFRGSLVRATAATGFREPSLLEALNPGTPRSRVFRVAEDQTILPSLTLTTTYFHHQFSHDYELRRQESATQQALVTPTLAYRTQGVTLDLRYHPYPRIQVNAGYTYLASLTEHSAAANGLLTAVAGARPFHRPPNTGTASAQYTGPRVTAVFRAAFAGSSDDSTMLAALPLANRDFSPGWVSLDAGASLVLTRHVTLFTQLTNLADSRTIAPAGYASAPFLVRTGLRIRIGRE